MHLPCLFNYRTMIAVQDKLMRLAFNPAIFILIALCLPAADAQPPGRDRSRDGGDRGRSGRRDGGGPMGPSSSFGSRLDQNGDGRVDQNELQNIPEGLRRAMEARGVKLKPGLSVEKFGDSMRKQFERSRDESSRPDDRRDPDARTGERTPGNTSQYRPPAPFSPRRKARLTVDLPPKYSELDTDYDGQVGLYEWITARREKLQQFDDIDVDFDGVLTPRELMLYDGGSASGSPTPTSFKRDRVTIVGGALATSSTTNRRTNGGRSQSSLSEEAREKHADFASSRAFPYLDINKDGKISMDELHRDEKTKRIIQTFEKAEIRVEEMSRQEFADRWVKAQELFARQKEEARGEQKR
ncbi:MAG: hypothetical protein P8J37_12980 [Fuerstiella sp.]|nr:hypothetical protein [Fuerstiella sp.]